MRSFVLMGLLWGLLAALVGWIALRDWSERDRFSTQQHVAMSNAARVLGLAQGDRPCPTCHVEVLRPVEGHVFRVRLTLRHRVACLDIDNDRFRLVPGRAARGVHVARCPS